MYYNPITWICRNTEEGQRANFTDTNVEQL